MNHLLAIRGAVKKSIFPSSSNRTPFSLNKRFVRRSVRTFVNGKDDSDKGYFILEDGSFYRGTSFAAKKPICGESVFTTGMVGYPESLTDPSYRGEILVLTYPLIGNYGLPSDSKKDKWNLSTSFESSRPQISGLIVSSYSAKYSHWNAVQSLGDWLAHHDIPALHGVDTRDITKKIRDKGHLLGKILFDGQDDIPFDNPLKRNLVEEVSIKEPVVYGNGDVKIVVVDCGVKANIVRNLLERGATVKVVPWNWNLAEEDYDGLMIGNGPGDPSLLTPLIDNVRKAMEKDRPMFGVCLGNQVMALAAGGSTYKLKYGNRGQNQPCIDQFTGKCYVTSQNHGYAVDNSTLPPDWRPYFVNANDYSNEGIIHSSKPFFSVQFHPEARAGPYDTAFLFDQFLSKVREVKNSKVFVPFNFSRGGPQKSYKKVLLLGSGGLQIGQAGEFDYSGSQAIKALKEENIETILINPNIATIQTGRGLADKVYFLPVTTEYVKRIIEKERPDGIMLGFGGQTALNTGVELSKTGVFKEYGVEVLGTPVESVIATEDRDIFVQKLKEIDVKVAQSKATSSVEEALQIAEEIGYPIIVRAAYALGGLGSGFADNPTELRELARKALGSSPQILVEKSLKGWKEVEYEVMRDSDGNSIVVCNMENFDPMGIHTGESIVVAPSQTLSNEEYHKLRTIAINTINHLGIVGECNIQYTLDPNSEDYRVIEVNARLSRSSALASKATGYPLAFVAAKLGLGIPLPEIRNSITRITTACFEPSLDYLVVKMPRWDLKKFDRVSKQLGSSMKSVGEVMAIGRSFEEAIQKAIRMVDSNEGFAPSRHIEDLDEELKKPTDLRIFALAHGFEKGYSIDKLYDLTKIDKWFLHKLKNIFKMRKELGNYNINTISDDIFLEAKQFGFSDEQIAKVINSTEMEVRNERKKRGILPIVKQIDTLAAEFPAYTNYLYMTYNAQYHDLAFESPGVMVLGSGVYRIGSSVEFDYCAVSAVKALREMKKSTVMVNYNPETVSTDYDESDRLYFEELSTERVMDIYEVEKSDGVIVSVGGQQPNNIALKLHQNGLKILGTSPENIDRAEDRYKFSKMLDSIGVSQPEWKELTDMKEAFAFCESVGYPVLVRPSYVLSGAAMNIVEGPEKLEKLLSEATSVSPEHPVVITKVVTGAMELEIDGVAQDGKLVNWAISEHIENAGVHSGDATMVMPADTLSPETKKNIFETASKISKALEINGPFNTQFLFKDNKLMVIETNLRASRSFPLASKTFDIDFIGNATRIFMGEKVEPNPKCDADLGYVCVKAPMFSFQRLPGVDPILGVEMASTGEVACFGRNRYEALLKSLQATRLVLPKKSILLSTGKFTSQFIQVIKDLQKKKNFFFYATPETAEALKGYGVESKKLEYGEDILEHLKTKKAEMLINFPSEDEGENSYKMRRTAIDFGVPVITNPQLAKEVCIGIATVDDFAIEDWDSYVRPEKKNK